MCQQVFYYNPKVQGVQQPPWREERENGCLKKLDEKSATSILGLEFL